MLWSSTVCLRLDDGDAAHFCEVMNVLIFCFLYWDSRFQIHLTCIIYTIYQCPNQTIWTFSFKYMKILILYEIVRKFTRVIQITVITLDRTSSLGLFSLSSNGARNFPSAVSSCSSLSADPIRRNTLSTNAEARQELTP